jgi:membrane protease YdiL (CAAX protease family)
MHSNPITPVAGRDSGRRPLIAPAWHTLSILLIFGYFGVRQAMQVNGVGGAPGTLSHAAILRGYFFASASEWGMAYWVWAGVHWKGGTLRELTGGRWTSWRSVAADVAIAIPFWLVWELTAWLVHRAVDRVSVPTARYHWPEGSKEIFVWILLSVSAGICEEIVFRGYLQQQFRAATGSLIAGIILQGAVFGLAHTYQGWKQVIVITALGILYGAFAAWRKNLRANMIAHAWSDVFEGWLRLVWGV